MGDNRVRVALGANENWVVDVDLGMVDDKVLRLGKAAFPLWPMIADFNSERRTEIGVVGYNDLRDENLVHFHAALTDFITLTKRSKERWIRLERSVDGDRHYINRLAALKVAEALLEKTEYAVNHSLILCFIGI